MAVNTSERVVFHLGDLLEPMEDRTKREHLDRYRLAAWRLPHGARALDVGCGCGYGAYLLATQGRAGYVLALDHDEESINYARTHFRHPAIVFQWLDAGQIIEDAPLGEPYDAVIAFEVLEHVADPERLVRVCAENLLPRGVLFASSPVVPTTQDNPWHKRDFTPRAFRALIRTRFVIHETLLQNESILMVSAFRQGGGVPGTLWPDAEPAETEHGPPVQL